MAFVDEDDSVAVFWYELEVVKDHEYGEVLVVVEFVEEFFDLSS